MAGPHPSPGEWHHMQQQEAMRRRHYELQEAARWNALSPEQQAAELQARADATAAQAAADLERSRAARAAEVAQRAARLEAIRFLTDSVRALVAAGNPEISTLRFVDGHGLRKPTSQGWFVGVSERTYSGDYLTQTNAMFLCPDLAWWSTWSDRPDPDRRGRERAYPFGQLGQEADIAERYVSLTFHFAAYVARMATLLERHGLGITSPAVEPQ